MNRPSRIACIVGAMAAILLALCVPSVEAGGVQKIRTVSRFRAAPVRVERVVEVQRVKQIQQVQQVQYVQPQAVVLRQKIVAQPQIVYQPQPVILRQFQPNYSLDIQQFSAGGCCQ